MKSLSKFASAALVASALTVATHAIASVPVDVTAAVTASQSACVRLQNDQLLLAISRTVHDAHGVAADLTLVKSDLAALESAKSALQHAVGNFLEPALAAVSTADTALQAAFVKLQSDVAKNAGAIIIAADETAIMSRFNELILARAHLQANEQALAAAGADARCGQDANETKGGKSHD